MTLIKNYLVPDPCLEKYCGAGRVCRVSPDGGVALCVCARRCARRHRPVCGSDGKVYANHCELHRAACNSGSPLTASRLMRCLHRGNYLLSLKVIIHPLLSTFQPQTMHTLSVSLSLSASLLGILWPTKLWKLLRIFFLVSWTHQHVESK